MGGKGLGVLFVEMDGYSERFLLMSKTPLLREGRRGWGFLIHHSAGGSSFHIPFLFLFVGRF